MDQFREPVPIESNQRHSVDLQNQWATKFIKMLNILEILNKRSPQNLYLL